MAPPFCQRCKATFESRKDLDLHISRLIACDLGSAEPPEGITPAGMQILKSRKEIKRPDQPKQTPEQKWEKIYKVLFPGVSEVPNPCKYLQPSPDRALVTDLSHVDFEPIHEELRHDILNDYTNFCNKTIQAFRTNLETKHAFDTLSTTMKDELVSLVKECNARTLENYQSEISMSRCSSTNTAAGSTIHYDDPSFLPTFLGGNDIFTHSHLHNDLTDLSRVKEYLNTDQGQAI
jgi:hypothetical protein